MNLLVKIGITYPKDKKGLIYSKRLLDRFNVKYEKVSLIADIEESIFTDLINKLKELGNEIYFLTEKEKKNDKFQKKLLDF